MIKTIIVIMLGLSLSFNSFALDKNSRKPLDLSWSQEEKTDCVGPACIEKKDNKADVFDKLDKTEQRHLSWSQEDKTNCAGTVCIEKKDKKPDIPGARMLDETEQRLKRDPNSSFDRDDSDSDKHHSIGLKVPLL